MVSSENTLGTFLRNGLSLLSFHVIHSRDTVASASPSLLTHVFNNHYQNVCYSSLREYFCITSVLSSITQHTFYSVLGLYTGLGILLLISVLTSSGSLSHRPKTPRSRIPDLTILLSSALSAARSISS